MIDKIKIAIYDFKLTDKNKKLIKFKHSKTTYDDYGTTYLNGDFYNFHYSLNESNNALIIAGSLTTFYYGDNSVNLPFSKLEDAFNKLALALDCNLKNAIVLTIEFGRNIPVSDLPEKYLRYLVSVNYLKTNTFYDSTLYFYSKRRELIFYDKLKEMIKNKKRNDSVFSLNTNLLRYEIKIKNPKEFFNSKFQITPLDICKSINYKLMFDKWVDNFNSIKCTGSILKLDTNKIKTVDDYFNFIVASFFYEKGFNVFLDDLELLKKLKWQTNKSVYTRLKTKAMNICNDKKYTVASELLEELKKKVNDAKRFYC